MLWLIPDGDLTPEQQDAIMAPCDSDLLITGGPGAGKTLILLYRLRFLLEKYPDKKFIFLVYTNSLKYFMQSSFENLGISFDMLYLHLINGVLISMKKKLKKKSQGKMMRQTLKKSEKKYMST